MTVGLKILMAGSLALLLCGAGCHRRNESIDRQAIERLHQLDVETTLTDSADALLQSVVPPVESGLCRLETFTVPH